MVVNFLKHNVKIVFKKLLLIFFIFITSLITFIFCEGAVRIKYLGITGAMQSIIKKTTQPSVLGTNNWVISDPDLDFRLNPAQPGINKFSMRDKEITIPKPYGLIRIIVLGDSIPYSGNPTFVDLMKNKFFNFNNVEILNASTPGYTTYQELLFLEKYLIKMEPDFVILSYCLNDNYTILHRFDEETHMLWTKEAEDSLKINSAFDAFINKSYFLTTIKTMFIRERNNQKKSIFPWDNTTDFNIAWKDYSWPDFSDRLNKMNNILKKNGGKLYVVIFPLDMQLDPHLLNIDPKRVTKPQQQVAYYSKKYDIPYFDLFQIFYDNKQKGTELYTDGIHLSLDGENLAANSINNFLLNDIYFRNKISINE